MLEFPSLLPGQLKNGNCITSLKLHRGADLSVCVFVAAAVCARKFIFFATRRDFVSRISFLKVVRRNALLVTYPTFFYETEIAGGINYEQKLMNKNSVELTLNRVSCKRIREACRKNGVAVSSSEIIY